MNCRCIPGPMSDGNGNCWKCGKPITLDQAEAERNRKLAQHAQRRQDAGLRASFARERKLERAKAAELDLFTAMMEEA
jgi:hypothetical protein